jgi:hypothetical protein
MIVQCWICNTGNENPNSEFHLRYCTAVVLAVEPVLCSLNSQLRVLRVSRAK